MPTESLFFTLKPIPLHCVFPVQVQIGSPLCWSIETGLFYVVAHPYIKVVHLALRARAIYVLWNILFICSVVLSDQKPEGKHSLANQILISRECNRSRLFEWFGLVVGADKAGFVVRSIDGLWFNAKRCASTSFEKIRTRI